MESPVAAPAVSAFDELIAEHKRIRTLVRSARDPEIPLKERRRRARALVELMHRHSHAEEASLYCVMLARRAAPRAVLAAQEEHELFENEAARLVRAGDDELWTARLDVYAELVERHLDEEERELFPLAARMLSREDVHLAREEYLRVMAGLKRSRGALVGGRPVESGAPLELDAHHPGLPVDERPAWVS